jgi:hypothetical protein
LPKLGSLPLARRDVERLRLIMTMQRRLRDVTVNERAQRALAQRGLFREALTWMELHGTAPEIVEHWMGILDEFGDTPPPPEEGGGDEQPPSPSLDPDQPHRRRRRRRRRGRRGGGSSGGPVPA